MPRSRAVWKSEVAAQYGPMSYYEVSEYTFVILCEVNHRSLFLLNLGNSYISWRERFMPFWREIATGREHLLGD